MKGTQGMRRLATCNPDWDRAQRHARQWAVRVGLATTAPEQLRLDRMGQGRMAGFVAPRADSAELALVAQWGAFIALVDDSFDQDAAGGEPVRVSGLLDALMGVLEWDSPPPGRAAPAVGALADLWRRTTPATSPLWARRFTDHYRQFADATCEEVAARANRTPVGLAAYLRMRRQTITVLPMLDLLERGFTTQEPALDPLRDATADIVAWTNDLNSAAREASDGHENLVPVLAREHGVTHHEAAAVARDMIGDRMEDFDSIATSVLATAACRQSLQARIDVVETFRDGSLAWQGETQRNRFAESSPASGTPTPHVFVTGLYAPVRGSTSLDVSIDRAARRLSLAVGPAGDIPDRCASRVLESALLLALLRATGTHGLQQAQLTSFLQSRRADADEIDALLIDACMNPAGTAGRAREAVRAAAPGLRRGTGGRGHLKTVMLRTVLHLLCGAPLEEADLLPATAADRITTYTDVNLLATRMICARAVGRPHFVTGAERERLVSSIASGRSRLLWEAGATTHLLALHAIHGFRPSHPAVADGILRMTLAQNPDGGMPFLDSQDVWLSAVAGLACVSGRQHQPLTRRMVDFVAACQADDGGWPFASGMIQTDLDTTTRCVEFLRAADPGRYASHLERATRYLLTMAGPTGGFPTWVSGDAPDLDMTAGAVIALAPAQARCGEVLHRAVEFILDAQESDGTFERSWTISEPSGILRALDALHAVPGLSARLRERVATATARALAHLASTQNGDGGWGQCQQAPSDVLSTAQAVPALARYGDGQMAHRGIDYLLSRQNADGGFTSVPDQTGPRPLPFDFPVLATIHTLSALHSGVALGPRTIPQRPRVPRRRSAGSSQRGPNWSALGARMQGLLLEPHDVGYEQGRLLVNQRFDDVRPQAIAYPGTAADVTECVRFAKSNGIEPAIRSGGHSYAGYSTGPGLIVNLRALNSLTVGDGTVRMGAGTMGMQAHTALAAAGAGLPLGRCPTIGVAGATLGGGLSAFTRAWGLAIDHLREVDIVTADGVLRTVRSSSLGADRDLFWAMLGGGGGNFGVVTVLEFSTVDIRGLSFTSLLMRWPLRDMAALIEGWTAWTAAPDTPRELRTAIEQLSDGGSPSELAVTGTFIGTPDGLGPHLDRLVAAVGRAESHRFTYPCTYVQAAAEPERWGAGAFGPRVAFAAKSQVVRRPMTRTAAEDMAAAVEHLHAMEGVGGAGGLLIDSLGGAVNDHAPDATAFPHRSSVGVVQYHSYWNEFTPRTHIDQRLQWLRDIHTTMHPHLGTGGYVNGMDPELTDWQTAYHGSNYARLQEVKASVDPGRFFDFPQAVMPAAPLSSPRHTARTHRAHRTFRSPRGAAAAEDAVDFTPLASQLRGQLLEPDSLGFGQAALLRNQRYDVVQPQAVARIMGDQDAAACLAFAAERGLPVAIRSGGHSYAGFSTSPGLVIDVGPLQSVKIGPDRVTVGAGVSSLAAGRALSRAGLAIPAGRWGSVGVSGLTLGGGKSAFTRAWGLSCDRMTGATVVTPDGRIRHVTQDTTDPDAELFWALRGAGGGNFGVVTALEFDPVPISGLSFAHFQVQWPHADMEAALRGWQVWQSDPGTPREVCCDVRLILDGDGPAKPTVCGAWIGNPAALRSSLDDLIAAVGSPPTRIAITPSTYTEAAMVADHPLRDSGATPQSTPPTRARTTAGQSANDQALDDRFAWAGKSHIVRAPMTDSAITTLTTGVDHLYRIGATGGVYLDSLGGAVTDTAAHETAFPHREALAVLQYIVTWPPHCPPTAVSARLDAMRATHSAMQSHLGTGAYVNDTDPELGDWEHAYYAGNYPRLQHVKSLYDPHRVLDFPQAITPSSEQRGSTSPLALRDRQPGRNRGGKVWFITGAARGLGQQIAHAALKRGDHVLATARDPRAVAERFADQRDRVLTLPLDVTDPDAAQRAVAAAMQYFGRIDVVVNNAGYADLGSIEDTPPHQIEAQINTNLLGVINVTRAAIPSLREQGNGHFIQISSACGRITPGTGLAAYHAAKHGVEGFSGALANEMKPFGVNVTVIAPGGFRTEWGTTSMAVVEASEPYRASVGAVIEDRDAGILPPGDPEKAANVILQVADMPNPPLRLALGLDATALLRAAYLAEIAQIDAWLALSGSTDAEDAGFPHS